MSIPEIITSALSAFPQSVRLENDEEITLRPATKADKDGIVSFAGQLDENDLLFLRVDITRPAAVSHWLKNIEAGETVSLLALKGRKVVGYATVDRNAARWTRRVGEIRVNIAPQMRSKGLGRHLTSRIFDVARKMGLKKLVAHMTPDQAGAQAAFRQLGFFREALLADYIEDRDGNVHDLAIMSHDIDGLSNIAVEPLTL